jgi:hypothetical protein
MVSGAESDYLLELRAEYLAANPDGEFNEHVKRAEVVKGMDILAVLASWGHPDVRQKESPLTEHWVYRDVDEQTKDWLEYTLTFRRSVLTEWDLARHFAAGGRVDVPETGDSATLSRSGQEGLKRSGPPKKK